MKLELIIPTSLNEIPLKSYQKFQAIAKGSNDDEFIARKMIECFCGIELKEIVKMKYSDVVDLVEHFDSLFSAKPIFENKFKLNGVEFGFIPDLENISLGEFVDLESNLTEIDTLNKAMAVMFRPIKTTYKDKCTIEKYETTAKYDEVMQYAPLNVTLGARLFFWTLRNDLIKAIPSYLEKVTKQMSLQQKDNSIQNGDGIHQYMHSLKEILESLMKSPNYQLEKPLPTLYLKKKKQN
jgi:hypothetical protein